MSDTVQPRRPPSGGASNRRLAQEILEVFQRVSPKKRRQLWALLPLMLAGAVAEWVTLSSVVMFLVVISNPAEAAQIPFLGEFLKLGEGKLAVSSIWLMTGIFMLAVLISMVIRLALTRAMSRFAFAMGRDLGIEMFRRILYQPFHYHAQHNSSEVLGAVNKAHGVATAVILPTVQAIAAVILASGVLIALLWVNAPIALAAGGVLGVLYWGASRITIRVLARNSALVASAHTARMKVIQEGVGGVRDIVLESAQELFLSKFNNIETGFRDAQARNAYISQFPRSIIEALGIVTIALLAAWLSAQNDMSLTNSIPVLGALALGAQRLLPQVHQIYSSISTIRGGRGMLGDLLAILRLPIRHLDANLEISSPLEVSEKIELRKVSFRYDEKHPLVLEDVDLVAKKGETVGIVGETGSGKSTLVDLIMGLLEPTSGTICADGQQLAESRIPSWHRSIAHVAQHIFLLDESIARNIAFSEEQIDRQRLAQAASVANMGSVIERGAEGLSRRVGERGARLSGGERQRLGIARAIYKNADLLVMDEATSALDDPTAARIMRDIKQEFPTLTIIIVTHNPKMLDFCDRIYSLERGKLLPCAPR